MARVGLLGVLKYGFILLFYELGIWLFTVFIWSLGGISALPVGSTALQTMDIGAGSQIVGAIVSLMSGIAFNVAAHLGLLYKIIADAVHKGNEDRKENQPRRQEKQEKRTSVKDQENRTTHGESSTEQAEINPPSLFTAFTDAGHLLRKAVVRLNEKVKPWFDEVYDILGLRHRWVKIGYAISAALLLYVYISI